jgi:hypothetical protein
MAATSAAVAGQLALGGRPGSWMRRLRTERCCDQRHRCESGSSRRPMDRPFSPAPPPLLERAEKAMWDAGRLTHAIGRSGRGCRVERLVGRTPRSQASPTARSSE